MTSTPFQTQLLDEASRALQKKGISFESFAHENALVIGFESVVLTILDESVQFTSGVLQHKLERKSYRSSEALVAEAIAYLEQLTFGWGQRK